MAKDHSHPEPKKCAHDLGWCEKCERPYCKACGQEWHAQKADPQSALMEAFRQRDKDDHKGISSWPVRPIPMPYRIPQWLTQDTPPIQRYDVYCAHSDGQA